MANSLSLLELFALLAGRTGAAIEVEHGPARESDQRVFVADIRKASRLLEWTPRVGAPEGVARMLAWCESQGL
jgi:CDP-paratose 2-epimerase